MKKSDVLLILALAVAAGIALLMNRPGDEAEVARVYCRGEEVWACSLREEGGFEIAGVCVEIKNGRARISSSDCPDNSCVNFGWLSRAGQSAVCLPNAVSLVLEGGDAPDAVIY